MKILLDYAQQMLDEAEAKRDILINNGESIEAIYEQGVAVGVDRIVKLIKRRIAKIEKDKSKDDEL